MRLVDANVLIYAVNRDAPLHDVGRTWLDEALGRTEPLGFAWLVLLAFLRLSTKAALFARPLDIDQAMDIVEAWLGRAAAVIVHPTARHAGILRGLLSAVGPGGNLTSDAHLAALSIEHGAELISFDRDFGRFQGVRWRSPAGG